MGSSPRLHHNSPENGQSNTRLPVGRWDFCLYGNLEEICGSKISLSKRFKTKETLIKSDCPIYVPDLISVSLEKIEEATGVINSFNAFWAILPQYYYDQCAVEQ